MAGKRSTRRSRLVGEHHPDSDDAGLHRNRSFHVHATRRSLDELAGAAKDGDAEAFERLARRCYPLLYRWATAATGDPDEADDVTQDTLLRVQRGLARFRAQARFTTWLYRVMRSVLVDRSRRRDRKAEGLRRAARAAAPAWDDPGERMAERIDARALTIRARAFLGELPDRQRQVFDLADLQGFPATEIAEMLELSPGTVRAHLFRARRTLRRHLLADDPRDREDG